MKILITGGAGFIGSRLAKKFVEENHSVKVFDNLLPQVHGENPTLDLPECELVRGDVRDLAAVEKAVAGVDLVYHLAAETGVGQSQYEIERYVSTNTHGTAVVLQEAAAAGVKQVIVTSSRAVYGEGVHVCSGCGETFVPAPRSHENLDAGRWEVFCPVCGATAEAQLMKETDAPQPTSVYGLTKLQQEELALQVGQIYKMPVTILRLFNVFGPGQSLTNPYVGVIGTFFRQVSADGKIDIYEDGAMRRDFVYVADVIEVLKAVGNCEPAFNRTINVGHGEVVTLSEVGAEVFRALNKNQQMNFSGKYRLGDIHHAVADTSLIKEILDYCPPTRFADGLREYIDWALAEDHRPTDIDAVAETQLLERNLLRTAKQGA